LLIASQQLSESCCSWYSDESCAKPASVRRPARDSTRSCCSGCSCCTRSSLAVLISRRVRALQEAAMACRTAPHSSSLSQQGLQETGSTHSVCREV
jgi:hypothetical protein